MANEKEIFGMPKILITFKTKSTTAIARSARGIVAMILKNETTDVMKSYKISDITDIPDKGLTDKNVDLIKKCLLGTPLRILVYTIPDDTVAEPTVNQSLTYLNRLAILNGIIFAHRQLPAVNMKIWPAGLKHSATIIRKHLKLYLHIKKLMIKEL